MLDDKTIDAVSIATPNHWHALATIWACQAGKDVYVEKPVSHNVSEGRRMVEAARKYNRIVQTGTQCRSHKGIQDAIDVPPARASSARSTWPRGSATSRAARSATRPTARCPPGVDYNLWLGPAPERPFNPNRFHYNWHWNWDYGNGDLGNQGIHQMDLARWGLGKTEFPKAVHGLRRPVRLQRRRPDAQHPARRLRVRRLRAPVRGPRPAHQRRGRRSRSATSSTAPRASSRSPATPTGRPTSAPSSSRAPAAAAAATTSPTSSRPSRPATTSSLNADIEEGHLSSAYCHLGNIAYRLGRKLHINPSTESFVNDSEADAMLTREYRAPFVVPSKV